MSIPYCEEQRTTKDKGSRDRNPSDLEGRFDLRHSWPISLKSNRRQVIFVSYRLTNVGYIYIAQDADHLMKSTSAHESLCDIYFYFD